MIVFNLERFAECEHEIYPHMDNHYHEIEPGADRMPFALNRECYKNLEMQNRLLLLVARDQSENNQICGYLWGILHNGMHSSKNRFFTTDAFYVAPEYRFGLVGISIFREMKEILKHMRVDRWVMSCMVDHDTTALFRRIGAKPFEISHAITLES